MRWWARRQEVAAEARRLDALANRAAEDPAADDVERVLFPAGRPTTPEARAELFELYKLMVGTSEALIARRQGTSTFFLTVNGLLLTAIGLFIRAGADARRHALVIAVFCLTGLVLSWAWRGLLLSFGQLNKGKFAVVLRLEKALVASVFDAEWEALGRGRVRRTYASFTPSESKVPLVFMAIYALAGILSIGIALT